MSAVKDALAGSVDALRAELQAGSFEYVEFDRVVADGVTYSLRVEAAGGFAWVAT